MSESSSNQARRRSRREETLNGDGQIVSYVDETGAARDLQGDEDAPYVYALGRASSDGSASAVADGESQILLCDSKGQLYVVTTPSATGIQKVEGDVAHDAADSASANPVKIGSTAIDGVPTAVTANDRVQALLDLYGRMGIIPWPRVVPETSLVADADLADDGEYTASGIVDVTHYRRVALFVRYTPGAAGGYARIIPLVSAKSAQPLVGDDSWYALAVDDGSVTATLPGDVFPSVFPTPQPEWGQQTHRGLLIRTEGGDASTDVVRLRISLDVTDVTYLFFIYAEAGVTDTPGSFGLRYSLAD